MCLAVFALEQHPRFSLVIAANRDEFFDRPAAPLGWWTPSAGSEPVLAGRDLSAGGTWFGMSASGRLALLTNVRDPGRQRPGAPSRGVIVTDWLAGGPADGAAGLSLASERWQAAGYNGFNIVAADLASGRWGWTSSSATTPVLLPPGIHGLSNASLDTPWPKVMRLRSTLARALASASITPQDLVAWLFEALQDDTRAPDDMLPRTGVPLEIERALSSVFIRTDDGRYGTRCSTVVLRERDGVTHVLERTYAPDGGELSWVSWPCWPGPAVAVQRVPQPAQGLRTTLPSTWRNEPAS